MNISREKVLAIVQDITTKAIESKKLYERTIRRNPELKVIAKRVVSVVSNIPVDIRRELGINFSVSGISSRLADRRIKSKRLKYPQTIKNEIVVMAMNCSSEKELLKMVKKINPFQS